MVDVSGWMSNLSSLALENFSTGEALGFVKPLVLFVIGIVIYSIFIFKFYRFIARKDIFTLDTDTNGLTGILANLKQGASKVYYAFKHILLYPLIIIFYFLVIVTFFAFLAKTQAMESIMLIAMALVTSIRVTAYYDEDLSKDLAKMIPFALLGIFLVDISYFSFDGSLAAIMSIPSFWKTIIYYLLFAVVLEFVLRIGAIVSGKKSEKSDAIEKEKTKKEKK